MEYTEHTESRTTYGVLRECPVSAFRVFRVFRGGKQLP